MNFIFSHCISTKVSDDDVWTDISRWGIPLPPTAAQTTLRRQPHPIYTTYKPSPARLWTVNQINII